MFTAIIIDDEPLARSIVKEYLAHYPDITLVQECNDGFEGVKAIQTHHPDLVFLDIQMPKINGFEMLELLDTPPSVIFTTAFDEYALKAFEQNAVDYLLKPFNKERFDKALSKWQSSYKVEKSRDTFQTLLETAPVKPEDQNRVVVKAGNNIKIIPVQDIFYIEAYDDYVKIYTKEGYFLKKKTMAFFEKSLNEKEFLRVHRSYIVPVSFITRIEPFEKDGHVVLLKNGSKVPVSKSGYGKLKEALGI